MVASPKELTDLTRATVETVRVDAAELSMAIVPFHLDAERTYRGLLDTGLSPFPLWATFALWRTLTGLNGPDERTRSYVLPNARGDLQFVGARPRRSLRIGDWELHPEEIVYLASGPNGAGLEQWSPPVDAILGPSLFARNTVVIFDIGHRRIGFTRRVTP